MESKTPNPISPFIAGQLPEFVRIDHPTMVAFLNAYYEWLDQDNTYLRSPKRLKEVVDIDTTMEEFVNQFKKEFLFEFPETLAITDEKTLLDTTKLAKNIKTFYAAKGTEKTYDFLFRILYDTAVEFYYPKRDILKLSDGKWILKKTIKISNVLGKQIYDSIGQTMIQRNTSGGIIASGRVLDVSTYRIGIYDVAEISLGGINGVFQSGYSGVEFTDRDENLRRENRVFSVLGEITITNGGSGYRVGDRVVFTPAANDTGVKGSARVSEVDSTGAVNKIIIDNFGVNYKTAPTISVSSEVGSGFAGTITVAGQANYPGYYANNDGRLSTNKVMQDNRYYQNFSYVLLTEVTVDRYKDIVRRLLNPAGMAFYGKVLLKRCAYADLNQETALIQYDVPIIGHYLPYTWLTYDDLSKWFRTFTTENGEVVASLGGYNRELHDPLIRQDFSSEIPQVPDNKVDTWDFISYKDRMRDLGLPEPSFSDFLGVVGNPVTASLQYIETTSPIKTPGFKNADPFWIVYQHPNRRMNEPVVARIPYDLKNEFLTNHGGAADFGIPAPTGACGTTGYWKEWTEDVTANREAWAAGFTGGDRYVMLSYNPLVPFYSTIGGMPSMFAESITGESLTAYRGQTGATAESLNPTFLYDPFVYTYPDFGTRDYSVYVADQTRIYGPKLIGGKRCFNFGDKELSNFVTQPPSLNEIVSAVTSRLTGEGLTATSEEYIMLSLDRTFDPSRIQHKYKLSPSVSEEDRSEMITDMVYVLRRVKEAFPLCKIGFYDYPRIPNFVWLIEDLYRSLENYPLNEQKKIAVQAAENIKTLIQEQDVMYLNCHMNSPSLDKIGVIARRLLDSAGYLNEAFVQAGKKRKKVFLCTNRLYQTNSKEVPNFFISNAANVRDYVQEYKVVKPSEMSYVWGSLLDDPEYGCTKIDGFYNTLNPSFISYALLGSTAASSVTADYNNPPDIFNSDRSTNTIPYKNLLRKSFSGYVHYSLSYTGGTSDTSYSATGPTALSPAYWFPIDDKKIDLVSSDNGSALLINESMILPLYASFNYILATHWAKSPTKTGNLDLVANQYLEYGDSPEGASGYGGILIGDYDGSGVVDMGDVAWWLIEYGPLNPNMYASFTGNTASWFTAPYDEQQQTVQGLASDQTVGELLGYNIAYSDFRKITARAFFEMPVGREFNCTTDQITPPPHPQVYPSKINGSSAPADNDFDYRNEANTVNGGDNLILDIEAVRGITGTPTEGISSLIYLGYYGIRTLWAELYAVRPANIVGSIPEKEYLLANAGPFKPTSTTISINTPFPNFENPNTTDSMFTCSKFVTDGTKFVFRNEEIVKDGFFMRLKLVFRNSANAIIPESTKVITFNYIKTS